MLRDITRWFTYARWANAHMLDACDTIDAAALTRDLGSSFGTILGTIEHTYGADWIWLERWLGRSPAGFPAKGSIVTIDGFRTAWTALADERDRWLSSLDAAQLSAPLKYRNTKGESFEYPLGDLLFHVSNHATYHRGQVMQMVRQLGGSVKSTDFLYWLPEAD